MTEPASEKKKSNPLLRAFVDYAGAAGFLVGFLATRDVIQASWWLVGGSAVALAVGFIAERRIAPIPLLAGGMALVFGVLTVVFKDPRFIMVKPTVINALFGFGLLGGHFLGKSPIKLLMGDALVLSEAGWRQLTVRYGIFFLALAALNEFVWRTQPPETWVWFKFPGLAILTVLFSFSQVPGMLKDAKAMEAAARAAETQD